MFHELVEYALNLVPPDATLGLGTGRAASAFIEGLGTRVRQGFQTRGVPTSQASADLATCRGIPLVTLEEAGGELDLAFDGADEVDPQLNLIKGYGGALVREKIVAAAARRFIVLVGVEKLVPCLGDHGKLPVEVVPFGLALCRRRLQDLGLLPSLRQQGAQPFHSDNGNYILDCGLSRVDRPEELQRAIAQIPGVVDCGLFLGMASEVLVQDGSRVITKSKPKK